MGDSIHTTTDSPEDSGLERTLRLMREEWQAPLQAKLDAVRALHRKQTRYMLEGYEDRSWDSEEDARAWDDSGWQTGRPLDTFDVCAECSRVEWDSVSQQTDGEGSMGITSAWPCKTATALGDDQKAVV